MMTSRIRLWAPRPIATPTTPADTSSARTSMPISCRMTTPTRKAMRYRAVLVRRGTQRPGPLGARRIVRRAGERLEEPADHRREQAVADPSRQHGAQDRRRSGPACGRRPRPETASAPPSERAPPGASGRPASGHAPRPRRPAPGARDRMDPGAQPADVPHRLERDEVGGDAEDDPHDGRAHEQRLRGDEEHAPHELPEVVRRLARDRRGDTPPPTRRARGRSPSRTRSSRP